MVEQCEVDIHASLMPRVRLLKSLHRELRMNFRSSHKPSFVYGGKQISKTKSFRFSFSGVERRYKWRWQRNLWRWYSADWCY